MDRVRGRGVWRLPAVSSATLTGVFVLGWFLLLDVLFHGGLARTDVAQALRVAAVVAAVLAVGTGQVCVRVMLPRAVWLLVAVTAWWLVVGQLLTDESATASALTGVSTGLFGAAVVLALSWWGDRRPRRSARAGGAPVHEGPERHR